MPETWQVWVAMYAAIVATGALFLEIRRWFEGRARLYVSATPGMTVCNLAGREDQRFLVVNVTNRGGSPTTLQIFGMHMYPNWWHRILRRPSQEMVVTNPSIPGTATGQLPHLLQPGAQWTGAADDNEQLREWIETEAFYVAVYASHADRPKLARVKVRRHESSTRSEPEGSAEGAE